MKKALLLISVLSLATAIIAKPEKVRKKTGPGEGRPSREEVMKKFDKDGDGKLNEEEKAELRKQMAERGAGRKVLLLSWKNLIRMGTENCAMMREQKPARPWKRRAEMIEKFDKDGDGKLNQEERKAAMASRTNPVEQEKKARREKEIAQKIHLFSQMPPAGGIFVKI